MAPAAGPVLTGGAAGVAPRGDHPELETDGGPVGDGEPSRPDVGDGPGFCVEAGAGVGAGFDVGLGLGAGLDMGAGAGFGGGAGAGAGIDGCCSAAWCGGSGGGFCDEGGWADPSGSGILDVLSGISVVLSRIWELRSVNGEPEPGFVAGAAASAESFSSSGVPATSGSHVLSAIVSSLQFFDHTLLNLSEPSSSGRAGIGGHATALGQ